MRLRGRQESKAADVDTLEAMKDLDLADGRDCVVRHCQGPERAIRTGIGPVEISRVKNSGSRGGGLRHELRNAPCAFGAHGSGVETALLPSNTGQKLDWQPALCRRLLQCAANLADTAWCGCRLLVA
jgi:hypothetical protein